MKIDAAGVQAKRILRVLNVLGFEQHELVKILSRNRPAHLYFALDEHLQFGVIGWKRKLDGAVSGDCALNRQDAHAGWLTKGGPRRNEIDGRSVDQIDHAFCFVDREGELVRTARFVKSLARRSPRSDLGSFLSSNLIGKVPERNGGMSELSCRMSRFALATAGTLSPSSLISIVTTKAPRIAIGDAEHVGLNPPENVPGSFLQERGQHNGGNWRARVDLRRPE